MQHIDVKTRGVFFAGVVCHYKHQFQKAIAGSRGVELLWRRHQAESGPTVTERYSHSACYYRKSVYVFGGTFIHLLIFMQCKLHMFPQNIHPSF